MLRRIVRLLLLVFAVPAGAAWPPVGADLQRPRILLRESEIALVQQRLSRSPYTDVFRSLYRRIHQADGIADDDHAIGAERIKARAAKDLAFAWRIDRTVIDDEVVPFSSEEDRAAAGDRVRDWLLAMYTRSRLVVDPPLGGWDRDISTSEELLQYATAYDTLAGGDYAFGEAEPRVVENLAALASELYDNYAHPETAFTFPNLHQNNHRSKTGAALAVAAVALAEYQPAPGSDVRGIRQPALWADLGVDLVDLIVRHVLGTGDGAYAEGPFYWRYSSQNLLPFARSWDAFVGGDYVTGAGLSVPNLWRHPLFARSQRWMLDMTLPDGSLAPVDDGNPGRSHFFGIQPPDVPWRAAAAWRWEHAPQPYDTEGNVDLAADAIVAWNDNLTPAPPEGSPTAFYIEGGNAIFRSDWSEDAVVAIVQGEHDTASELGRDRSGRGVGPQSHEHAEPGSFLLHAFGEALALDPGYLDFLDHAAVNQPEHHNIVLVDGKGPVDYLDGSSRWRRRTGRPPVDGHAIIDDTLDTSFVDAATVVSRYGRYPDESPEIRRRFLFVDDSFLVIADTATSASAPTPTFTFQLHGNGGEDSGGSFVPTELGGRWARSGAVLDWLVLADAPADLDTIAAVHEIPGGQRRQHSVRRVHSTGEVVRALEVVYPSRTGGASPTFTVLDRGERQALRIDDPARDRVYIVESTAAPGAVRNLATTDVQADGDLVLASFDSAGRLLSLWAENATTLGYGEARYLDGVARGSHGLRFADGVVDVVSTDPAPLLRDLPFAPRSFDGACFLDPVAGGWRAVVTRRQGLRLREVAGGFGSPIATPEGPLRAAVGTVVTLDGRSSCDPAADNLTQQWQLVSAPPGSAWHLEEADSWEPRLELDRPGPYRLQLTIGSSRGASSLPAELLVVAGEICDDGMDGDHDGLIDGDDPDCDAGRACAADCSGEGQVDVVELVRAVSIALGERRIGDCLAADTDGDGAVTVDEILAAIDAALAACA